MIWWECAYCRQQVALRSPLDALEQCCPGCTQRLAVGPPDLSSRQDVELAPVHVTAAAPVMVEDCLLPMVGATVCVALLLLVAWEGGPEARRIMHILARIGGAGLLLCYARNYWPVFVLVVSGCATLGFYNGWNAPTIDRIMLVIALCVTGVLGWKAVRWFQ